MIQASSHIDLGAIIQDEERLLQMLTHLAEPFRLVQFSYENFIKELGNSVETPIGKVEVNYSQFVKIFQKKRQRYFGLIKPTFENPLIIINHTDQNGNIRELFVKTFLEDTERVLYFVSVAKDSLGFFRMVSGHLKSKNSILKKIREGSVTHQIGTIHTANLISGFHLYVEARALTSSKQEAPNYTTLELGFPFKINSKKYAKTMLGEIDILSKKIQAYETLAKYATGRRKEIALQVLKGLYLLQKQQDKKQEQEGTKQGGYDVVRIPITDIFTDTNLFQQRSKEYSERSVNNIISDVQNGKFVWQNFDPITLWIKPENGKYYVLSGHSRLEAFKRLSAMGYAQFNTIPAKIFEGTLAEAQKIAKKSNTLSTKESYLERAKYYQDLRSEAVPEKEIIAEARQNEDKNASFILNLSHLNFNGELIQDLQMLTANADDSDNTETLKRIASWIGYIRSRLPLLDNHENELYKYLVKDNRYTKYNQSSLFAEVEKRWKQREMFNTPITEPLNMENFVSKTQVELTYDENLRQARKALKEAEEERENKKKELLQSFREQYNRKPTDEDIKRILEILLPYDVAIKRAEQEVLRLENQRDFIKQEAKKQMSLFGLFGSEYTQFKGKPKEAIKFLMKVKEGEAVDALYRDDIGYVSIVWGENNEKNEGYGLKHIIEKHGAEIEALGFAIEDFIPIVFAFGTFNSDKSIDGKIVLDSESFRIIIQTNFFGVKKKWLLSAFDLKKKMSLGSLETVLGKTFTNEPLPQSTSDKE